MTQVSLNQQKEIVISFRSNTVGHAITETVLNVEGEPVAYVIFSPEAAKTLAFNILDRIFELRKI